MTRALALTAATLCYVFAALSLYAPLTESWQIGWQRHAVSPQVEIQQ